MNMDGFEVIHDSNLTKGTIYYHKSRFGAGFVLALESTIKGWTVELQQDAEFTPPLKRYRVGDLMIVPPGQGFFYEPQG